MRYKAAYKPQFVLGDEGSQLQTARMLTLLDPESLTWHPLNGELMAKLDERPYVSLSRDRQRSLLATPENPAIDALQKMVNATVEMSEENMSLFDIYMPGVMTAEEVESQIDLNYWSLVVRGTLVHMIVRGEAKLFYHPVKKKLILASCTGTP
jgi:arginine-tRNA-protein transferase